MSFWRPRLVPLLSLLVLVISLLLWAFDWRDMNPSLSCSKREFRLQGMTSCHELLSCRDYSNISLRYLLQEGTVKSVFLGKWGSYQVAISRLRDDRLRPDFTHNLQMLSDFSSSAHVVKLLGSCNESLLFTEYHPLGSALNWPLIYDQVLSSSSLQYSTSRKASVCFEMCISYANVLYFLHNSPNGRRVMCDSNTLQKLLSQFLITSEVKLVVNDMDALPEVGESGVICGHREVTGSFVAPEQLWPFQGIPFNESQMPPYDEKVDIYKMPDVCSWFLSECPLNRTLLSLLQPLHADCKSKDPRKRPSAARVFSVYRKLL